MYPELFSLGPITVYTYGVLLAASYLIGLKLAMWRAKKWGLDASRVLDLGIYIIIAALLGAKLLLLIVDFVDVYWGSAHFWAFNVADAAITVGAVLVLLDIIGLGRQHASHPV